jgi:hypothetical protein
MQRVIVSADSLPDMVQRRARRSRANAPLGPPAQHGYGTRGSSPQAPPPPNARGSPTHRGPPGTKTVTPQPPCLPGCECCCWTPGLAVGNKRHTVHTAVSTESPHPRHCLLLNQGSTGHHAAPDTLFAWTHIQLTKELEVDHRGAVQGADLVALGKQPLQSDASVQIEQFRDLREEPAGERAGCAEWWWSGGGGDVR